MQLPCNKKFATAIVATLLGACATTGPTEIRQSPQMPAEAPVSAPAVPQAVPLPPAIEQRYPVTPPFEPSLPQQMPPALPRPQFDGAQARALITRLIPARSRDRAGWAQDIHVAFDALRIPVSAENVCAVIAVTEQESLFVADPPVPGLSRIVWREIETRRARYGIPKLLLDAALLKPSPDGRSYRKRIDALKTEREMNTLYQDMISELPYGRTLLASHNPVRTGGPMQVSITFAERHARSHGYPYRVDQSIRNEVFTRRGGMYFGIAILMDYPAPYDDPVFRFADFNAGRYASRNAAFQQALAAVSGARLVPDGDLLRYRDGRPDDTPSQTRRAIERIVARLDLSPREVDHALRLEKTPDFAGTELYRRVFRLADARQGKTLPRATIPRIELKSPKITRKLTTEWFAKRVRWRFDNCRKRA